MNLTHLFIFVLEQSSVFWGLRPKLLQRLLRWVAIWENILTNIVCGSLTVIVFLFKFVFLRELALVRMDFPRSLDMR